MRLSEFNGVPLLVLPRKRRRNPQLLLEPNNLKRRLKLKLKLKLQMMI